MICKLIILLYQSAQLLMQKETLALNSLRDISEYTSYIDRKIDRLNLLYRSLDITKNQEYSEEQFYQRPYPKPNKFYSTSKSAFSHHPKKSPINHQHFYATEYPKKGRYNTPVQNGRPYSDLKSDFTSLHKSRQFFKNLKSNKDQSRSQKNNSKLKFYETIKQEMLGSFYVGSELSNKYKERKGFYPPLRHSEGQNNMRIKKGRLWHGRPPVKIIQKYD